MGRKLVPTMVLGILLMVSAPLFIAKNLQLGGFARSPQEVTMSLGSRVVVAGGRAKLWYAGGDTGADFEIQTQKGSQYFQPSSGESYEAYGVTVELIELKIDENGNKPPKAKFKVSWKN